MDMEELEGRECKQSREEYESEGRIEGQIFPLRPAGRIVEWSGRIENRLSTH